MPSVSAVVPDRPEAVMAADVKHVYEQVNTGDPVKDAVLADNARNPEAIDAAMTGSQTSAEPALR
ncbi:hypothetical protein [Streptomyces sp. NPDC050485]|uniref:hypothetical protein n=1 Tax=Streptomyces sp. NPDC050485 TaxID=3365617 RepID=UPI00378D9A6A